MLPKIFSILSFTFSLPSAFTNWVPTMEQADGYRGSECAGFTVSEGRRTLVMKPPQKMPNYKQRSTWYRIMPIKGPTPGKGGRTVRVAATRWGAMWARGTYLTTMQWGRHQFHLSAHRSEPRLGGSAEPSSTACQWLNCLASAAAQVHRPSDLHWGLTHPARGHGTGKIVRNSTTLSAHTHLLGQKEGKEFTFCVFSSKHQEVLPIYGWIFRIHLWEDASCPLPKMQIQHVLCSIFCWNMKPTRWHN